MCMSVAIIADTHIPDRKQQIPSSFRTRIGDADHVIHAGDFTTPGTLAEIRDLATNLTAVHGNIDGQDIGLPSMATVTIEDCTIAVTHGTAPTRADWAETVAKAARNHDADIGVGAHTHEPQETVHEGIRLLNPGSVTGAPPAEQPTMLTGEVSDGHLDTTLHTL